jgi:hypothetical protein
MLNPQIRGILGIMLIVIPIVGVGFGLLQATNEGTILIYVYDIDTKEPMNGVQVSISGYGTTFTNEYGLTIASPTQGTHSIELVEEGYYTEIDDTPIVAGGYRVKKMYMSKTHNPSQSYFYGYIYDEATDESISGAIIESGDYQTTSLYMQGAYGLTVSPAGTHTLEISKSGYETQSHVINIADNVDYKIDAYLVKQTDVGFLEGRVKNNDTTCVL